MSPTNKKIFILFGLVVIGFFYINHRINKQVPEKVCDHCNILLIDIDTLRADELPCYGYHRNTTPNICDFANKSLLFKNNYSPANWTLPSIFSTITSLYPTFHRVRFPYVHKLDDSKATLAKTLQGQGYYTVFIGKDDNTSTLTRENGGLVGYDLITTENVTEVITQLSKKPKPWFIHYYRDDLHLPYLISNDAKPIDNTLTAPPKMPINQLEFEPIFNDYLKKHSSEVFKKEAIDQYSSIFFSPDKPNDTSVSQLFYKLYDQYSDRENIFIDNWMPIYNSYLETFDIKNPSHLIYLRMMYDSMVSQVDQSLAPLFKKINERRYLKNTVTIIMSDHGESFGEYGTLGHDSNHHSDLYYTPLIVNYPKVSPKIIKSTTGNIDIFPTILELVGINLSLNLQGKSLLSNLDSQIDDNERFIYSENLEGQLLLNQNWLYYLPNIASSSEQSFLYNKVIDPDEKNNVANLYPELTQSLYKKISVLRYYDSLQSDAEILTSPQKTNISPQKLERLQKEGYF